MPIPKPKAGESQDDFIERCMGNDTMKEDYPDNDQRLAICFDSWRKAKGEKKMEDRGAIKSHKTGTSDKAWDGPGNESRLKLDQDAAFYGRFYAWKDPDGDPAKKSSYKFGHHDVDAEGNPGPANIRGCQAGIGVLNGARGGTTIPSADRKGTYNHMAAHLKDADVEPAELKDLRAKYTCECVECGHTMETDEHCRDLECPECGGEMRRKERPGPGRSDLPSGYEERQFSVKEFRILEEEGQPTKILGYPAIFNKLSEPLAFGFKEKIAPGAFKNALKNSDVRGLFNHDPNYVLGRESAGTLKLKEDKKGLPMEIIAPETQLIKDLVLSPMKRGDIKEGSFGFVVKTEQWEENKEAQTVTRTIVEVDRIFDVSVVTFPAYPDTSVAVRSYQEWRKENEVSDPEPPQPMLEGWEDITSADADQCEADLRKLDTKLRRIEVSKF